MRRTGHTAVASHVASAGHPDGLANSAGSSAKPHDARPELRVGQSTRPSGLAGDVGGTVSTRAVLRNRPFARLPSRFHHERLPGWSPLNWRSRWRRGGRGTHAALDERSNSRDRMYLCGEDLPEEANRVELDWEHQERFGLPGVRTTTRSATTPAVWGRT